MTRNPRAATFLAVAGAGVALAAVLASWGPGLDGRLRLPVQAVSLNVLFLPGAAIADEVWRGHLPHVWLLSAAQWPLSAAIALAACRVHAWRSSWAMAACWAVALLVPVLAALVLASPVLRAQLLTWWAGWVVVTAVIATVASRHVRHA
jgi:hypothetical protein